MAEIEYSEYDPVVREENFARTFRDTGNVEQRARYRKTISEAYEREQGRMRRELEEMQLRDPALMRAVTGRERETRMSVEGAERQNLAERKYQWDREKYDRVEGINEKRLGLQILQEQRLFNQAERELRDAERIEYDTELFESGEQELRDQGFLPGSQQYRDGLANLAARHPYVDPKFRNPVMQGSGVTDPDDLQAKIVDLRARFPNARITLGQSGVPTIVDQPQKTEVSRDPSPTRMDTLRTKIARQFEMREEDRDQDYLSYLQSEFEKESSKVRGSKTQVAQTPAAQSPQTAPATQATIWRVDKSGKQWEYNAQTKKPTGNSR